MKILFLTMVGLKNLDGHDLYSDLMREFVKNGHSVYIAAPAEKRMGEETNIRQYSDCNILRIKVGNMQKCSIIEKGISTVLFETQFLAAVKKYYANVKFDLVLYSTPPITFGRVVSYIKKRDNAKTYLLLKDIFPQNAVDLGIFSKNSIFYKYFRSKEIRLYRQSDYIGCMSQANVDYVTAHNPYIDKNIVHVLPNSINVVEKKKDESEKAEIRNKYNIPQNTTVFVYGGNLGKPQDIPFVIECLKANENKKDRFFVVCGTGTEYPKLKKYVDDRKPSNVLLINGLPKAEYEEFITSCDIGLIFLDHRFTIPNFPSRLLSYMQNSMPVLACTDKNTDIGKIITEGNFGWWCESNNAENVKRVIDMIVSENISELGNNSRKYLIENYSVEISYRIIESMLNGY